jgi:hypothetical protein
MSSDLWFGQADGKMDASLTMNVHGTLFLVVGNESSDNYQTYIFEPNANGIEDVRNLINGLSSWLEVIKTTKQNI